MELRQINALSQRNTDIQGALRRFCGNEALYVSCLGQFLQDKTMGDLNAAVKSEAWNDAFTLAHALKGLAGNMGFVPLMHSVGQLVVLIRGGRTKDIGECMLLVNSSYRDITDAIRDNFTLTNTESKGK